MNFTISTLARSLSDYLSPTLPGVTMYEDPNQQGSRPPMMFLQARYSSLTRETGGTCRTSSGAIRRRRRPWTR